MARRLAFGFLAAGLVVPAAGATVVYEQDFESVATGWSTGASANGSISFAAADSAAAAFPTRSLLLSHNSANTARLVSLMPSGQYGIPVLPVPSGLTYTLTFELRVSRTDTAAYVAFYDSTQGSQLPMLIQLTAGGEIRTGYWNGTANQNDFVLLSGYQANTTYTFTLETTPSTGLYSVSVTGGSASLVDQPYRKTVGGASPFTAFNTMAIYNDGGSASGAPYDLYIDNLRIESIPEPGALGLAVAALGGLALAGRRRRGAA
ncbi:MAG TPA: PEP-CTERM sorting domain-containing protein [Chthoniobacteraceae bacterium]|nr:PEP-CTERM sorting domain-containing protein [Chthoniobacteraceae bacterium]